ncbi:hypothetical protein [Nitrososphaera sp.]|uniref:hypothetical protein n=1 Tax=Nitrososphaera sp. TaxID=1971748 RepID=UPI00307F2C15
MTLAETIEKIKDELNNLQDRTGVPVKVILDLVAFLLLPGKATATKLGKLGLLIKAIADSVEAVVKKGSSRFTPAQSTLDLFNEFIASHPNFPYSKKYSTVTWYYNANMPRIGGTSNQNAGAITFEDRIYFGSRPKRTVSDISAMFHEFVHTMQYRKHGQVVFAAVYVGNYLWNLIKEQFDSVAAYGDIKFEKQAYDWDRRFADWLNSRSSFAPDENRNA